MFISENKKPKNLVFYKEGENTQYSSLEELQKNLKGTINKNQIKNITIHWKWKYEINDNENKQDSIDGQAIAKYNFSIYTIGNE